jgi:hypothetical protein
MNFTIYKCGIKENFPTNSDQSLTNQNSINRVKYNMTSMKISTEMLYRPGLLWVNKAKNRNCQTTYNDSQSSLPNSC